MRGLKIISLVLLLSIFPGNLIANEYYWTDNGYIMNWTSGALEISSSQWSAIDKLQTYNDVTVTMSGGGINQFYMHDNSSLTILDSCAINYLYLYGNTSFSLFRDSYMNTLYIDPAGTASVKIYGSLDQMSLNLWSDPLRASYGSGPISGTFLSGGSFHFDLSGAGSFTHVQFVPEPATLFLLTLGGLILRKRKA